MFCPVCRDEFRAGFLHCRACDVELVDSLDSAASAAPSAVAPVAPVAVAAPPQARSRRGAPEATVNFCGFLVLEDALQAKAQLREREVDAEILIKDGADGREECWLRVKPSDFRVVQDVLGYDESSLHEEGETVLCAGCETLVSADGTNCPHCGAAFEGD